MDELIEVKNLTVVYETEGATVRAVNGVSFSLKKKETLGIVGETGAGKTTMALSILRLLPFRTGKILSGEILLEGNDLLKANEEYMRTVRGDKVAMIFQDPMTSLNPVIRIGDQIAENIQLHNSKCLDSKGIENRVCEMLELVGIPAKRRKEYPHQFSGGMKQRVVIAMALACNPELLIADEPTTALDVTIQAQVLSMMDELKQRLDTSMILISHDLGVVAKTCDYVAIMYAGEIVEAGSIYDIFEKEEHHPYTKGLFGAIPDLAVNKGRLNPIEGLMPDPAALPSGCKFHPRCPMCREICKTDAPTVWEKDGHRISCHMLGGED